jgi:hypothetical protein
MRATLDAITQSKAAAHFRAMAFRIVYEQVCASVGDPALRFPRAITYSVREFGNRHLLEIWWAWTKCKSFKGPLKAGQEPPAELRPFVESYLQAIRERAKHTGDDVDDLI